MSGETTHPVVITALALVSIAAYTYQAAWVKAGFSGTGLGLLAADVGEAAKVARAAMKLHGHPVCLDERGVEIEPVRGAIRTAIREVPLPRAQGAFRTRG